MTVANKYATSKQPETYEDVLEQVGAMGRWHWMIYALIAYREVWTSMYNLAVVFYGIVPEHYCGIPELMNANWTSEQIKNVSRVDECTIRNLDYKQLSVLTFDDVVATFPDLISDGEPLRCPQNDFIFMEDGPMAYTMVSQFSLVCDRGIYPDNAQMIYMFGFFCGALMAGFISDFFGRRWVTVFSISFCTIIGMSHAYLQTWWLFCFCRFLMAFVSIPGWKASYTMAMEITSAKHRTWVGGLYWVPYGVGYSLLPVLACIWPESPRWQLNKGRVDAARQTLQSVAKWNGTELPADYDLQNVADVIAKSQSSTNATIFDLYTWGSGFFKYPRLILRSYNLYFNWFVNAMVYYGVSLSVSKFAGDVFWNNAFSGMVEIPAYFLSWWLLLMGRRSALGATLLLAGVTLFIVPWINEDTTNWLRIIFAMIGKFAITASFGIVYVVTAELYPTVMRTSGVATSSCIARVGSMLAPYIANIDQLLGLERNKWSLIIFGVFSLAAGILTFLLPETKGKRLPEQLDEANVLVEECHKPDAVAPNDFEMEQRKMENGSTADDEKPPIYKE